MGTRPAGHVQITSLRTEMIVITWNFGGNTAARYQLYVISNYIKREHYKRRRVRKYF